MHGKFDRSNALKSCANSHLAPFLKVEVGIALFKTNLFPKKRGLLETVFRIKDVDNQKENQGITYINA